MLILNSEWLQVLSLAVAYIIPTIVALVTARLASSSVKTAVLIVLAALLAGGSEVLDKGSFTWSAAALLFLTNVTVAVASHFGVTRNIGLSGQGSKFATDGGLGNPASG